MESRDGEGCSPVALSLPIMDSSASPSLCPTPINLPASEALQDPSELSSACEHAVSSRSPTEDDSTCLAELAHSSPELSSRGIQSPFTMAPHRAWQGASPSHLRDDLPAEASSSLEQPRYEDCLEEDSHCTAQELSDDMKREMLAEVCKGVSILSCRSETLGGCCYVYLIGTAHVSEESCREVQAAVQLIKPQVVFLELCHKRTSILQSTSFKVPTVSDMISTWKQRRTNMLGIVYSWFLAKVAAKLDIRPGSEFRAAYEEALACGAKVVLGDRDIEADQLNELIEKLKDADILTIAFEELGKFSPTLLETVITERDLFMTAALQKIAEHHSSIVAVVGRGHVAGITSYWGQDIPIQPLLEIPQKRSLLGLTSKTYVVVALVALTSVLVFSFR